MFPLQATGNEIETVSTLVGLVTQNGGLPVFAVISILGNIYFISQIMRGKLVAGKLYDSAIKEINYYRRRIDKTDAENWKRIHGYFSGLKASPTEEGNEHATDRNVS
ncbi:hypothetical protein D1872_36110 [compost metagenome]|jgi:hypothetical protein